MKISCFSDEIAPSLEEQIRVIKDLKLNYLEIRTVDDIGVLDLSEEKLLEIRKKCDENNLKITCVSSPIGKDRADIDIKLCEKQMEKACKAADIFGCDYIRIFSFFIRDIEPKRAFELSVERLTRLSFIASKNRKTLVMEGGKDTVGQTADVALKLFEKVNNSSLRCAFDMAALLAAGDEPFEHSLPVLRNYISYVHIKDMKTGESSRVPAGQGDAKVKSIINALRDEDFVLSLEPHLAYAGAVRGFSGEKNFRIAHAALTGILKELNINYS